MKIVVAASDEQWKELTGLRTQTEWQRVKAASAFNEYKNADAFFSLHNNDILAEFESLKKPILINSVVQTLADLVAPVNVYRINGWPGFLERDIWEIAGNDDTLTIFEKLQWKYISVADEPGLVSARIVSMIINEAYFALGENVSTKDEIDIAMKLGTNYPYGPFEWCEKIGLQKVSDLLQKLSETDKRYSIAPAIKNELTKI